LTKNQLAYWSLEETKRHNKVLEEQGFRDLDLSERKVLVSEGTLSEDIRHDQAVEAETARANRVHEAIDSLELAERERSNRATEGIRLQELGEQRRYHDMSIAVSYANLEEDYRHNTATEAIDKQRQIDTYAHNVVMENLSKQETEAVIAEREARSKLLDMQAAQMEDEVGFLDATLQKRIEKFSAELDIAQYDALLKKYTVDNWYDMVYEFNQVNQAQAIVDLILGAAKDGAKIGAGASGSK
jgi:hypothetical protein